MNLENIMQVKEASYKKTNIVWFQLHEVPRKGKLKETESRIEVTRG